jgi:regulator of sigma E protease
MLEILHYVATNAWSIALIVLFFGGSIFVHELGHYLAARSRGVHVERFSIGIGPAIVSWKGSDGTEYRIAWFPIGGYVLLPQLADLGAIEGASSVDAAKLPPVEYGTKMFVFVAGAVFNVLFAFLLACVIWQVGQPENDESTSRRIGYVTKTTELPNGQVVPSPAAEGGLRVGDEVVAIDGHTVTDWDDLKQTLMTGSGRGPDGRRRTTFTVERAGKSMDVVLYPRLAGDEHSRIVGIGVGYNLNVYSVAPGSLAARAGVLVGDRIEEVDGAPVLSVDGWADALAASPSTPARITALRDGHTLALVMPPRDKVRALAGLEFSTGIHMAHPSPFRQISEHITHTLSVLWSLINPNSDVGLSKMSGPVGIVRVFHEAADAGIRYVLMVTIFVNVNLAIVNLLPIPVLDGGQMVFATIGWVRGRALPVNFIMTAQSVFFVLIFSMMIYLSYFDVRRWHKDAQEDRAQAAAQAAVPTPAPAKP